MGEYSSLRVWKSLESERGSIFDRLYDLKKSGFEGDIYKELKVDFWEFGRVEFEIFNGVPHFAHTPNDLRKLDKVVLECKYNVPAAWLLCFDFTELNVKEDIDCAVFTALTTVEKIKARFKSFSLKKNVKNPSMREDLASLEKFLSLQQPQDVIMASSDMIYYNPDGEFGVDYVRKDINSKIQEARKLLDVPYWKKQ